ncbi:MAG: sulfur oxidation c-type cytochrome SoxX [Pseudomonadota bacterium]
MNASKLILTALLAGTFSAVHAGDQMSAKVAKLVADSFKPGEGQDLSRLVQDETQKLCSATRNNPSPAQTAAINAREQATIRYPDGNKLVGDWKNGEKLVKGGFGMRIGSIEPDVPARQKGGNGGNCYACHALDPKEVAAGNIGPSLTGYGALRGASDDIVKYTYDKIYNAQATVACSSMPRLGRHGVLTPEQIADVTAYLVSPESSLNKK